MAPIKIRDRVKDLRRVKASDLLPHPLNWRVHDKNQRSAIRAILSEVGMAGALVAYETPQGLQIIDGHLRQEEAGPDTLVPVLVLDVTEDEAKKLLAILDPLGDMAGADPAKLEALLAEVETESEALAALLESLASEDADSVPVEEVKLKPPPKTVWILLGIPLDRFGEVYEHVAKLQEVSDVSVQSSRDEERQNGQPQPDPQAEAAPLGPGEGRTPKRARPRPVRR